MDMYRISFYKTRFLTSQHMETTADKANHYHILKSNRKIAEMPKLEMAIKVILDDVGTNAELEKMINKAWFIRKWNPYFECWGFTFHEKYGVKLLMKLSERDGQ